MTTDKNNQIKLLARFLAICFTAFIGFFICQLKTFASAENECDSESMTSSTLFYNMKYQTDQVDYDHGADSMTSCTLFYNMKYQMDQTDYYLPQVSELLNHPNGEKVIIPSNQLSIRCSKAPNGKEILLNVVSARNRYEKSIPIITVKSISTATRVSTKKTLSAKNLDFTIHYSDGTSRDVSSVKTSPEKIKHPKAGKNHLTCYYNGNSYDVEVMAYTPAPKVSFKHYGTFALKKNKEYCVKEASPLTKSMGETYFNNHRETYYSQRVLPGSGLDIPGRHVADDGTIRDKDGYICVASDYSFCGKHEVLLTSLGPAKVYDTGCASGTIDIYVNW